MEKILGSPVLAGLSLVSGLFGGEALDALVGLVVVFNQELLALGVNPLEGVRAVAVHVAVAIGSASVGHQDSDLVESLGRVGPEVPGHVGVLHAGLRVTLLAVDEVGELDGVLDEEDGGVVTDHIVVALLGVVLDGEATGVTVAIVGTALTSNSGEAEEDWGPLANGVHESGLAETSKKRQFKFVFRNFLSQLQHLIPESHQGAHSTRPKVGPCDLVAELR